MAAHWRVVWADNFPKGGRRVNWWHIYVAIALGVVLGPLLAGFFISSIFEWWPL